VADVVVAVLGLALLVAFLAVLGLMIRVSARDIRRARVRRDGAPPDASRVGMVAYLASLISSPDDAGASRRRPPPGT
jgi:hypothetical protein